MSSEKRTTIVTRCDRCGATVERCDAYNGETPPSGYASMNLLTPRNQREEFDLCAVCEREFRDWLRSSKGETVGVL